MRRNKLFAALLCALLLAAMAAPAVLAAGDPVVAVSSGSCKVGEDVQITISMENVAGFTSGDLNIQYNPNILYLKAVENSAAVDADGDINMLSTEIVEKGATDETGEPVHVFNLSLFHLEQFPQALANCDLVTLTFEAIGGGECPLVLSASSFYMEEAMVKPALKSGVVTVDGPAAAEWNYEEHVAYDVEFTDASYPFAPQSTAATQSAGAAAQNNATADGNMQGEQALVDAPHGSAGRVLLIVVIAIAVVACVVAAVVISGKKKYVEK